MEQGVRVMSFGDRVHAPQGTAGRIRSLLLDRSRHQVRAFVLRRGLPRADYVIPADRIAPDALADGQLSAAAAGTRLPLPRGDSLVAVYAALDEHGRALNGIRSGRVEVEDCVLLHAGQPVYGPDGLVGQLQRIVVHDPGMQLVALVMCVGRLRPRCVRIPRSAIIGWAGDHIHISLAQAAVKALPAYRSDRALRGAIHRALHADEAIQRVDGRMISITVVDGCVTLTGHVAAGGNRARAEQLVRQVGGVRTITNEIVTDAQLTLAVTQAVTQVEHASRASVSVAVTHGAVVVFGQVPDAVVRRAIEDRVAEVPEVRVIINALIAPDMPGPIAHQHLLRPRRGQRVFARDQYIGRIARIILDPRLRQVTAVVVDSPTQPDSAHGLDDTPERRKHLVVPVHAIETLSSVEVFLNIDSRTAAMADEFHARAFISPWPGWRPPFPYRRQEIVFVAPAAQDIVTRPVLAVIRRAATPAGGERLRSGRLNTHTTAQRAGATAQSKG